MLATHPNPCNLEERLELAQKLYQEFYTTCFWHWRPDLRIAEDDIPFVVNGLQTYGGHRGFILAAKLRTPAISGHLPAREPIGCH